MGPEGISDSIASFFTTPAYYLSLIVFVVGNFIYMYSFMMGAAKRKQWSIIKYLLLVPFYWLLMSYAAYYALFQLIFKPHYWEKTLHGLHLNQEGAALVKTHISTSVSEILTQLPNDVWEAVADLSARQSGITSDGTVFYFTKREFESDVWMVEQFASPLASSAWEWSWDQKGATN